jgi:transposase-like protein
MASVAARAREVVAGTVRVAVLQPDTPASLAQWAVIPDAYLERFPRLATFMDGVGDDVPASPDFPANHWRKEIERRTDVVGIFSDKVSVLSLIGAILAGQHDVWQAGAGHLGTGSICRFAGDSV